METLSKEQSKLLSKEKYYSQEQFINDCYRYKKAIEGGRVICNIASVSKSGMNRTMKFVACEHGNTGYNYCNFIMLFTILGFKFVRNSDYIKVGGCGMDMVFATNYQVIKELELLGVCTREESEKLCQMTPTII